MKRSLRAVVAGTALIVSTVLVSGCAAAQPGPNNAAEPEGLAVAGTLQVCTYPEYSPMEYYKDGTGGEIVGFDADLSRAVGDAWGVKTEIKNTEFDGLIPGLASERCDLVISGLYVSDARKKVADAVPYLQTGSSIAAAPGEASKITDPESLSGMTVAVQSGSSFVDTLTALNVELKGAGKAEVIIAQYPKTPLALGAVLAGKAQALMETDVAVVDMVSKNAGAIVELNQVFPPDQIFGAYFRQGSPLVAAFQEQLSAMNASGALAKLVEQYGLDPAKLVVDGQ